MPEEQAAGSQPSNRHSVYIRNVRIVQPGRAITSGDVVVKDGLITAVDFTNSVKGESERTIIEGANRLLTPGLIDVHTHGIQRYLFATNPRDFLAACDCHGQYGVTSVLPTIVPQVEDGWVEQLAEIANAIPAVQSLHLPGLHVEGPFLAIKGSAAATLPGDLNLLAEIIAACGGYLSAMSVSPETPNILPVIRRLRENGTKVFLTHTKASVEETDAAIAAGATHATHFYDVFYAPEAKDPGVRPVGAVEAILADRNVTVDFIADGIHVHPTAIRLAVAAKGYRGVCLITDAVIGAGLPPDIYDTPWGFQIRVKEGDAPRHVTEGYLSGSGLTMDRGMKNLLKWLDLPSHEIWAMGTSNPATLMELDGRGNIEAGAPADLVLWDDDMTAAQTWVKGMSVYCR